VEQPRKTLDIGSGTRSRDSTFAWKMSIPVQYPFDYICRIAEEEQRKRREEEEKKFMEEINEFRKQHPVATEIHTPKKVGFEDWKKIVLELESIFGNTLPESFKSIRIPEGTYSYVSNYSDEQHIQFCLNERIRYKINHLKEIDLRKIEERKKKIEEEAIRRFCIERDRIENEIKQKKWEDGKEERERQFKEKQEKQKKEKEEFEKAVEAKLNEWHPKLPKLEPVVEKIESKPQQPPYKIPPFNIDDYPTIKTHQDLCDNMFKYTESIKHIYTPLNSVPPELMSKFSHFCSSNEYKNIMACIEGFSETFNIHSRSFAHTRLQHEFFRLNQ
jgi:hypothetical protein